MRERDDDRPWRCARARPDRAGEEVEADLLALLQHEGRAPSTSHSHMTTRQLGGPADREVEEVAEDDLDDEGDEHHREQARGDVLRPPAQPGSPAVRIDARRVTSAR